jgi:Carboxypeptidase regulatory-like domain
MRSRSAVAVAFALILLARADAGAAPQGQAPPPAPPKTAAITGVVIDGASKAPIAGALVTLSRVERQITDAKGRFAFVNLAASPGHTITATRFGYFEGTYGRDTTSHAPGAAIPLREGEWVSDLRVTLWRPGVISGTVVDERGEALVGVWVRALAQIPVAARRRMAVGPAALTDDRGAYRLAELRPGRYLISVPSPQPSVPATLPAASTRPAGLEIAPARPPDPMLDLSATTRFAIGPFPTPPPPVDGRVRAYPVTFHPAALSASAATAVELAHGEERAGVDIRLEPVPTTRLSGIVQGPPEAFTRLWLRLLPAGLEELGSGSETATTLVAPDGTFMFLSVPAGAYTLEAQRSISEFTYGATPSFRTGPSFPPPVSPVASSFSAGPIDTGPAGAGFITRGGSAETVYWARMPVAVGGRDDSGVAVVLRPAVRLRGRVAVEFDPARPAPTMTSTPSVTADPATGDPTLGRPTAGFQQDASDGFTIESLLAGSYFLRPRGSLGWLIKSAMWNGRDYADVPFDAATGQDITGVLVTMTNAIASVGGIVRDAQGRPAAGAAVIVFPVERRLWSDYGLQPSRIRTVSASADGAFLLTPLPGGEYYLVALPGGDIDAWQRPDFFKSVETQAVRVSVDWGETKTQDIVAGGARVR